ncbi:hypothetical protein [Caulobacter soli]|uniref:hypothetical protein n=1 Tax=Caulobacter soli TaxID=2708539 RepID=UPI0013EAC1AE|nr:hypothetical protein [Caulobacter soli]
MTEPTPTKVVPLVIGITDGYNFMNVADPDNPTRLSLDLSERCVIVFRLSDTLVANGWTFQSLPFEVRNDYGINFSSYFWVPNVVGDEIYPYTQFKVIYECARMGIYDYSLFMTDSHGQSIDLDPKIENGTGRIP